MEIQTETATCPCFFHNYQFSSVIVLAFTSWPGILMLLLVLCSFFPDGLSALSTSWSLGPTLLSPFRKQKEAGPASSVLVINTSSHTHKCIHILGIWPHPDRRMTGQEAHSTPSPERKPLSSCLKAHPVNSEKGGNAQVCLSTIIHSSPLSGLWNSSYNDCSYNSMHWVLSRTSFYLLTVFPIFPVFPVFN